LAFPVAGLLKDPSSLSEEEAGQIGKGFHKNFLSFLYTERLCDFV
jgi:hypothetical protein